MQLLRANYSPSRCRKTLSHRMKYDLHERNSVDEKNSKDHPLYQEK